MTIDGNASWLNIIGEAVVHFPLRALDTEKLFLSNLDRNDHDVLWRTV